jgi:TPR repeat protein
MGDNDSLLTVGLCYLFGYGTKQDCDAAYRCFKSVVDCGPTTLCQRSIENARYWMAVAHLIGVGNAKKSVTQARKLLEIANADNDHEQANEILNLIGKTRYLA